MSGLTPLLSSIDLHSPCFRQLPAPILVWCEGVWTDLLVHKTARAGACDWTFFFGRHRLDFRTERAYFTLVLIHILFCHEYKASSILLVHLHNVWPAWRSSSPIPPLSVLPLFPWPLSPLAFSHPHIKDSRNDGCYRLCMRRDVRKYGVVAFLLLKWRDFVFLEDYYDRKCELAN